MKKIWKLLRQHIAADFSWKLYVSVAVFLAVVIFVNYRINLENGIIDKHTGKPIRIFYFFLMHGVVYFTVTLLAFYFNKTLHFLRSPKFWLVALTGLIFLSISTGFPYNRQIAQFISSNNYSMFRWWYGIANNTVDFFVITLPLLLLARRFEARRENLGVNFRNVDLKPYWQILLIVAPLVIVASFEAGFKSYYPVYSRYEITEAKNVTALPVWVFASAFEFAYGIDFFNVELLFRGMLVIGVSQVIGKEAILPMVAVYCALHFGKPVGECISSIFGGYVLGVVAFYTRNIWGGVIVHIGLAWMMELAAFVQRALSS